MIIIKYLVRETLKNQISILFILLLIFFCQNLVKVLSDVVDGNLPIHLVISLLLLGMPKLAQLILPLSLFLSLLITFRRMHTDNEIIVMHACGFGKDTLIFATIILAIITSILAAVNVFWANPIALGYKEKLMHELRVNPTISMLIEGQFKLFQNDHSVLFIEKVKGRSFKQVFLAQVKTKSELCPSIVVAKYGHISLQKDGSQIITLDKGTRFEGATSLCHFRITEFNNYQAVIGHRLVISDNIQSEQISMLTLWQSDKPDMRAEFHWRLTLVASVILMALLVVPLSIVNSKQNLILRMLPIILLYLIFFLTQTALFFHSGNGKLDPIIGLWGVNAIYCMIAISLNIWDTAPIRKLRAYLKGSG